MKVLAYGTYEGSPVQVTNIWTDREHKKTLCIFFYSKFGPSSWRYEDFNNIINLQFIRDADYESGW